MKSARQLGKAEDQGWSAELASASFLEFRKQDTSSTSAKRRRLKRTQPRRPLPPTAPKRGEPAPSRNPKSYQFPPLASL